MADYDLPYFDERAQKIDMIVLHCSMHPAAEMVEVLRSHCLSSHYVVGLDGEILAPVAEEKRAWHAGVSCWQGRENLNHNSIGIEISSLSLGQEEYGTAQIESVISLCRGLIEKYHIRSQNIVGHSDVAPTRKPDPGIAFPWKTLAENGVGLWYNRDDAEKVSENDVASLLRGIGYDISHLDAASYAFCLHFLPYLVEKTGDIHQLIEHPYKENFVFPQEFLPVLKACYFAFQK